MNPAGLDLASIIADSLLGTLGVDLFVSQEPDAPDDCTTIYVYAGEPDACLSSSDTEIIRFQVRVRNAKYLDGYTQMSAIRSKITKQTFTITNSPNTTDYRIYETGGVIDLPRDHLNRPICVLDFGCIRTQS